jgi:AsmA protein
MIRKILVTLFILILLISIGIVSLIVFVDPNNFRGFISDKVRDKTGYELTIEGDLRWHIWPQISILTDSVKLSDIGAQKPILTADNMRLDVELFPLFSKRLVVKNVFVKSAVINITEESKGKKMQYEPPHQPTTTSDGILQKQKKEEKNKSDWKFTLNKFEISDSTVILQQKNNLINFRNLTLTLEQNTAKNISVDVKGNIDRNQQYLFYTAKANIDLGQYPEYAKIELEHLDYIIKGIGIPSGKLKGNLKGAFNYQQKPRIFETQRLTFSVNDNIFTGHIHANLDQKTHLVLNFNADRLNLDSFADGINEKSNNSNNNVNLATQQTTPVVSTIPKANNELIFLNLFDAETKFTIKELVKNKLVLNNVNVDVINKDGIATFNDVSFDFAKGHIVAKGFANGKQKETLIKLDTKVRDVDLNTFFNQIDTGNDLVGLFNATGELEASTITLSKLSNNLQGKLGIVITNARLDNINIQNIIQSATAKYTKDVLTIENQKKYTEFHEISANAYLSNGNINLTSLTANSETLDIIEGSGRIGMEQKDLDVNLNIKMLGGWNGKSETIAKLQQLTIPFRIYGQFTKLNYQIDISQVLKDLLNDKIQQGLDKLRNKLENRNLKDDKKSNSKQKAAEILEGLLKNNL